MPGKIVKGLRRGNNVRIKFATNNINNKKEDKHKHKEHNNIILTYLHSSV